MTTDPRPTTTVTNDQGVTFPAGRLDRPRMTPDPTATTINGATTP